MAGVLVKFKIGQFKIGRKTERVIAYVDGFNLYFGLKEKQWRRYYWLNVQQLALNLLKPSQVLVHTKYFTSRVFDDKSKQKRQTTFIEALETLCNFQIFYGKYLHVSRQCPHCATVSKIPSEKMTDVNIATEMLGDAFRDKFDLALLVSADSDLVAPVTMVKRLFNDKRVLLAFPPKRFSQDLANLTSHLTIGRRVLARSQFSKQVVKADEFVLNRPSEWQ